MPVEQTRDPVYFRKATSRVRWGHFGDHHPPVLYTLCSDPGDVLLRGYGQFARYGSTPRETRSNDP